jgi:hypothetical protein
MGTMNAMALPASGGVLFLQSATERFRQLKALAEKAIAQATDEDLFWMPGAESNSIAVLIQHLAGNMISRWTDFLTTDGEKPHRQRDAEFEHSPTTRAELMVRWEEGWRCLFYAIGALSEEDLLKTVTIRGEAHSAIDAIVRQLVHYGQHVGQIVYIAKARQDAGWQTLSIPRKRQG